MARLDDRDYHLQRERDCRAQASRTIDAVIAALHLDFAERYAVAAQADNAEVQLIVSAGGQRRSG